MKRAWRNAAAAAAVVGVALLALTACVNGDDDDAQSAGKDASTSEGDSGRTGNAVDGGSSGPGADASGSTPADSGTPEASLGDAGAEDGGDAETGSPGVPMYVASGYQNRRIVSLDGKDWTNDIQDPPDPQGLDDVASGLTIGKGTIVAAGHTGIYTSRNGKTWTHLPAPVPQKWPGLGGAAAIFADGRFVIVTGGDSWTSTDAVTFTKNTPATSVAATHWNGIAYGNGHYLAAGDSNGPGDRKVSEDGVAWHDYVQDGQTGMGWSGVAFGNGVFVLAGQGGRRAWTTDGTTITAINDASLGDTSGLTFGDGKFVLTAGSSGATSTDGKTWTKVSGIPNGFLSYGSGLFLANTWVANILESSSGTAFSTVYSSDAGAQALSRTTWGLVGAE